MTLTAPLLYSNLGRPKATAPNPNKSRLPGDPPPAEARTPHPGFGVQGVAGARREGRGCGAGQVRTGSQEGRLSRADDAGCGKEPGDLFRTPGPSPQARATLLGKGIRSPGLACGGRSEAAPSPGRTTRDRGGMGLGEEAEGGRAVGGLRRRFRVPGLCLPPRQPLTLVLAAAFQGHSRLMSGVWPAIGPDAAPALPRSAVLGRAAPPRVPPGRLLSCSSCGAGCLRELQGGLVPIGQAAGGPLWPGICEY